jgi:putative transposase
LIACWPITKSQKIYIGEVINATGNTRNGKSRKTLKGEFGELPIEIPRDPEGSFEPQIISKHQTRWVGFAQVVQLQ